MTDPMREAFEEWMRKAGYETSSPELMRRGNNYAHVVTNMQWAHWQAAYAAGVAAERERAANVCEAEWVAGTDPNYSDTCWKCAAAIRRGE